MKGKAAIEALLKGLKIAMDGAGPRERVVIFACFVLVLFGIVTFFGSIFDPVTKRISLAAIVLGVVAVVALYFWRSKRSVPGSSLGSALKAEGIVLSNVVFDNVRTTLQDTQRIAFEFLRTKYSDLSAEEVRANIFLPVYGEPNNAKKYMLEIYQGLHVNMERQEELEIRFKPNQGATGYVFKSGKKQVALRLPSGKGEWSSKYNINKALAKIIHPNLKWIITVPLTVGGNEIIGVLNVDGLGHQFSTDTLTECMVLITSPNVVIISDTIASNL